MPQEYLPERGWVKRPKQGQMYGKKYMDESYKSICKYLFELGEKDSNQKKGPSQMYGFFVSRNQHKYLIFNESEMRTLISLLVKSKRNKKTVMMTIIQIERRMTNSLKNI
mmetsp:Transcript_1899/g.2071  ORF Transcript_1899/g.2071 Transcript_1899/m.2071 type:complete len:110 (-) Transcript_1899:350-679(-)